MPLPLPLMDGALGWFDYGRETRLFGTVNPLPFGANFAIRRRMLDMIGLFRTDLGTGGMALGRGEETELLMRARDFGAQGIYVGEALCFHAYSPKSVTQAALYRCGLASGRSHNAIVHPPHHGSCAAAVWFLVKGLFQILKGCGDRFRQSIINAGIEMGTRKPVVGGQQRT